MAKEINESEKPVKVIRFDWAIKHILRNKANFDVLEGFLSALLKEDMQVIEILESESNKSSAKHKFNRVDLLVKDKNGRKIIVEVQNASETDFMERLIWGASNAISESIQEGQEYEDIAKVISISIVYFHVVEGNHYIYKSYTNLYPEYYGDFKFVSENEVISWYGKENKFPEYYILDLTTYKNELETDIDEWIYMLKNSEVKPEFKSKNIDKAREKLNKLKMTVEERSEYRDYMMNQVVLKDNIKTATREGHELGLEQGLEEGHKQGHKQGLEQGLEQGIKKGKLEIAKNLIGVLDINTISEKTGLSVEEVIKLEDK
ncbi:MAG: hypothetical protein A2Y22_03820 [Clostridiales bacterium GWD2_32_59]|nr:MAG: hypothetical protein A2Y22_03820 [Clostridiales bacterium GWD2_32_59]